MRIAIVVLRYGLDIAGGAESQSRGFAEEAARRGWDVEVWTTCVENHYTWENKYPIGSEKVGEILVHRFPVHLLNKEQQHRIEVTLASRQRLTLNQQYKWLEGGAHSPALYEHIAQHAEQFDAIVVLPYAQPMMNIAAWAAPERVIMWPCLHDEPYAYLEPIRLLLESVFGVMFNSPEERDLAIKQLKMKPHHDAVLGEGVTVKSVPQKGQYQNKPPQDLLYVGRLEGGKNLALLYEYMSRYAHDGGTCRLVVLGKGPFKPPQLPAFDYRGFVSEEEKSQTYASSLALCQPSLNESFSLTTMESWLSGRPSLVHSDCAVTRGHVQRSKGGLCFRSYNEFVGAIEWLQDNPVLARQMGQNGQQYVRNNYTWQVVVDRFERILTSWKENQV